MMKVVTEFCIEKSARKAVNAGIDRLKERLKTVEGQNIQLLPNSDYLIHERYYVHKEFFFTYKSKIENHQLRLLCWFDQKNQMIVIITCISKKKTKEKYYRDFEDYARVFYNTHIR